VGTGGIQPYLENERGDWVGLGDGRREEGLVDERVVRAWHACDEAPGDGTWNGSEQQRESNGESSEGLAMSPLVWRLMITALFWPRLCGVYLALSVLILPANGERGGFHARIRGLLL
jgi:hypothetical protein